MTRSETSTKIGFTEAIGRAGPVLFGDDWIGELTPQEIVILKAHGPRSGKGADGSIAPCPDKYRRALDRALGRELRANAQRGTVVDWLHAHGFVRATSLVCDGVALSRALARRSTAGGMNRHARQPGRPPDKTLAAVSQILAAIQDHRIDFATFCDMREKEICSRFNIGRAVARTASKLVISELSKLRLQN